jgi:NAD(P)-dependent dehydrogenase (short-subunit alcohol dehydrogenase family)
VITGANRGIGRGITKALAKTNSSIIMACRNIEKSFDTYHQIKKENNNRNIELLPLDLASIRSIQSFINALQNKKIEISVLINNAGVLSTSYQETIDGFELTIGVNYIGQYLLTRLLLPLISKGTGRVINISSIMYRLGRVDTNFFRCRSNPYHGLHAYADSKLAFLLFSLELAEQTDHDGITVNSVDPGIVNTDMITMNKWFDPLTDILFRPFIKTEDRGALTSVFLATDHRFKNETGKYFINGKERKLPHWVITHPFRKELWEETEKKLGIGRGERGRII